MLYFKSDVFVLFVYIINEIIIIIDSFYSTALKKVKLVF